MSEADLRELQAALSLVLMTDIPLARMDPDVHTRMAVDIVRARRRCSALLAFIRRK